MFSGFFGGILKNALIILAIVAFVIYLLVRPGKQVRQQQKQARQQPLQPKPAPAPAADPDPVPTVTFPDHVNGLKRAYFYPDVNIIPVPDGVSHVVVGEPLTLHDAGDTVQIFQGDSLIGYMEETRLAGMVRDWIKNDDPVLAYVAHYSEDSSSAMIGLAFYLDMLARFQARHPNAKRVKLTGKPEETLGVEPGDPCEVDKDFEKEKYIVSCDGFALGALPAAVVTFAQEHDLDPEDLTVVVASVEYDYEKLRDFVYVFVDE